MNLQQNEVFIYLQVCRGIQIPEAPYDVEAFGLRYYHPCTMPELLPPSDPINTKLFY